MLARFGTVCVDMRGLWEEFTASMIEQKAVGSGPFPTLAGGVYPAVVFRAKQGKLTASFARQFTPEIPSGGRLQSLRSEEACFAGHVGSH